MVRPNVHNLYYVGFYDGFVVMDAPGNIYKNTREGLYANKALGTLKNLSYIRLLDTFSTQHIDSIRRKNLIEFIVNINNYDISQAELLK